MNDIVNETRNQTETRRCRMSSAGGKHTHANAGGNKKTIHFYNFEPKKAGIECKLC